MRRVMAGTDRLRPRPLSLTTQPSFPSPEAPARRVGGLWGGRQGRAASAAVALLLPLLSGVARSQPLIVTPEPPTPAAVEEGPPLPLSEEAFEAVLRSEDLTSFDQVCPDLVELQSSDRLRRVRTRMLELYRSPQPLEVVLAAADVLLRCQAPHAALTMLDRYGPAPGGERVQWLLLQWRAATAALDHRRAGLALERLAPGGALTRLDDLSIPVQQKEDGTVVSRTALDLLVDHLVARAMEAQAGDLLLGAPQEGVAGAKRLQEVVRLLAQAPLQQRDDLLEAALEQAAEAGAWGLVAELLDQQIALPSDRGTDRRLRLSPRIDDVFGEWQLRRQDPDSSERAAELEQQLRSPRGPGGHATGVHLPPPPPSENGEPLQPPLAP